MRNFSYPPYDVGEMGRAVKRLSELTGVPCSMHEVPFMEAEGQYSITALSDSIVKIGAKYGIPSQFTNGFEPVGKQLQSMIDALAARGIVKHEDF